jgi:hypothetical protein
MFNLIAVRISEDGKRATFTYPDGAVEEKTFDAPISGIEDFIIRYLSPAPPREAGLKIELLDSDAQFMPMIIRAPVGDAYRLFTFAAALRGDYILYVADGPSEYWTDSLRHEETDRATVPLRPSLWRRPHVVDYEYGGFLRIYINGNEDDVYSMKWLFKVETYEDVVRLAFTVASLLKSNLLK